MSEQTVVPLGYAQEAIAPYAVLTITGKPDWDAIYQRIQDLDALYDNRGEEEFERVLADMRFPS